MQNLNAYDQESFELKFKKSKTYDLLKQKYDEILFDKFVEPIWFTGCYTARQHFTKTKTNVVPWYYLDYLDASATVVDLGCGCNFFKPYFPNLIGIGAEDEPEKFFGDIHDFVDDDFYQNHVGAYKSVFSINALHFHPLENIRSVCENFSNMLEPGGRGFITINAQRMIDRSTTMANISNADAERWIRSQFDNFPNKILVFDLDLTVVRDAWMNGNIRIVFEK